MSVNQKYQSLFQSHNGLWPQEYLHYNTNLCFVCLCLYRPMRVGNVELQTSQL